MLDKIKQFAELLEKQQIEYLYKNNIACEANILNVRVKIKEGKKYIKINIGTSGKYMIDREGNIFGIKAYGVIHKGHKFGTLDTTNNYYWGGYRGYKKDGSCKNSVELARKICLEHLGLITKKKG